MKGNRRLIILSHLLYLVFLEFFNLEPPFTRAIFILYLILRYTLRVFKSSARVEISKVSNNHQSIHELEITKNFIIISLMYSVCIGGIIKIKAAEAQRFWTLLLSRRRNSLVVHVRVNYSSVVVGMYVFAYGFGTCNTDTRLRVHTGA